MRVEGTMTHVSNEVASSSTESSEDEEEARKIREALCDESIYKSPKTIGQKTSDGQIKNKETKYGPLQVEGKQTSTLKSNRTADKNDYDDDNILQTTPGFRAYVAKQLSNMLDSDLADSLIDDVWQAPKLGNEDKSSIGILLFSNSKTLCRIDVQNEVEMQQPKPAASHVFKHRKHKLSTSSESSEDEKISACVFSVSDIQKENKRLAMLEKQPVTTDNEKSIMETNSNIMPTLGQLSGNSTLQNGSSVVKKKKKKKKSKKKNKKADIKRNDNT